MHELEQTRADMADGLAVAKRNFVAVQKEADGIVSKVTDEASTSPAESCPVVCSPSMPRTWLVNFAQLGCSAYAPTVPN